MRVIVAENFETWREGEIVEGDNAIAVLRSKGAAVLPVEPDVFDRNPLAGYYRRAWGRGQRFDRMIGQRGCSLLIYAMPGLPLLHWIGRVEPIEDAPEHKGTFRLTTNTGVHGVTLTGGLVADTTPINVGGDPDKRGGWSIGGSCRVNCSMEGFLALSIYGVATGLRVAWVAVTQTR